MKYIFDFDDVLFKNTPQFKEYLYACLEEEGVPRDSAESYYKITRGDHFWLKKLLDHFSVKEGVYEKILKEVKSFINIELLEIVKKLGKENCYIVTWGGEEFQRNKIIRTDIAHLFSEIIVVPSSKKEAVEKIAALHKDEKVIFIDDKAEHLTDLDLKKYPNLKTILFTSTSQLLDALPGLSLHK